MKGKSMAFQKRKELGPPLKWAGGKRWLIAYLKPYWERHHHRRLVEPFCGALAVSLALMPERALLNDVNPHLVNFLKHLQSGLRITIPLENKKELYYAYRERFNLFLRQGKEASPEAAMLFYYLNRTGYNGLCRFNRKGEFNVPFGRYKKINYVEDFSPYAAVLKKWTLLCGDFEKIPLHPEDFIYADPPYDVEFRQYAQTGFEWEDQVRLARWLARHPGPVLASNQATDRIVKLYRELGFMIKFLNGPRMISCTGDRTPAREILALKGI
ncbi:MAG: Dam family site-specific DNA-(adenine-N6)-methyltransferase [Dethiobacteria bacterium]